MEKMKIALDVDGIIANFYLSACKHFGHPYKSIDTWGLDWIEENFNMIANSNSFWLGIETLSPPEAITFDFDCYMTSIPEPMKIARESWLKLNGFPEKPVVVSHDKLEICKEMGIDVLIDDKPSTIEDIRDSGEAIHPILFIPYYFKNSLVDGVDAIRHLSEVNEILDLEHFTHPKKDNSKFVVFTEGKTFTGK